MEITGEGLMLDAGTVLAGMAKDERGRPRLALRAPWRYSRRPMSGRWRLMSWQKCAGRWSFGTTGKARAHIHLAHASLPLCEEEQALRLFVADELIEAGPRRGL